MKKIKSLLLIAIALAFTACTTNYVSQFGKEQKLTVLHTNDHHGHPTSFYKYPSDGQGGLPARAALINKIRSRVDNVLVLDAGDFNTGNPESNFFNAEPDIMGYNYIGYDAVAIGNHEFDVDMETMQEEIALSEFPWLCANVTKKDGSYIDNVQPYIIKDMGDFKVAIFGLLTKDTEGLGSPDNVKDLVFKDEISTAYRLVPKLQAQADVVIALVHMGLYDNDEEGSRRLAANVPGIDLIIDGHTHTKNKDSVVIKNKETGFDVPVVSAYKWGLELGRVDLTFVNGEITEFQTGAIPVNQITREVVEDVIVYPYVGVKIEEDQTLAAKLQPYKDEVALVLDEEIGYTEAPLSNDDSRKMETALGNLVTDSMLWFAREEMGIEADFAVQNGGGIRAGINPGVIKKATVYEVLPFENSVAVVTMTGRQVRELFEYIGTTVGTGANAQVAGATYTINVNSKRLVDLLINGEPLDLNREYKVATNSYIAQGGDHYEAFLEPVSLDDSSKMQRDVLIDYIAYKGGNVDSKIEERIIQN